MGLGDGALARDDGRVQRRVGARRGAPTWRVCHGWSIVVDVLAVVGGHDSGPTHVTAGGHLLVHVSPSGQVGRVLLLEPRCAGEGAVGWCVKASGRMGSTLWPVLLEVVLVVRKVGIALGIGSAWGDRCWCWCWCG